MAKINSELELRLQSMPNRSVDLIVRTDGDPSAHVDWLTANNVEVRHVLRLLPGVAVSCPGRDALNLLAQDWVVSVEADEGVRAM